LFYYPATLDGAVHPGHPEGSEHHVHVGSKVLNGRGTITPEMALRLELVFKKPSADHWLRLQNAYDLWQSRQNKSDLHVHPYHSNYA